MYQEQLRRIQQKLSQAKAADKDLEVFGASSHKYHLNPPVSEAEVLAFEKKYGVSLPKDYRAFLQTIGDANAQKLDVMAGPYYGLSAFGTQVDDLLYEGSEIYLKAPCALSPDMTQEEDMQDEYQRIRLEKQRKTKRRKYIITLSAAVVLLFALLAGTWYAFTIGKEKTFNTEHWVTSSYGYPAITLSTPEVLKREKKANELDRFTYITSDSPISIMLITNSLKEYLSEFYTGQEEEASQERTQEELNELVLRMIEKELKKYFKGENILIKDDTYTTAQGVAGHKVFGSFTQKEKEIAGMEIGQN